MNHYHFLLFKPFGYLSQFVCDQPKKKLLGELADFPPGTMAIGRLDEESEGLLLLTTDGKMSEEIRSRKWEKHYVVQVDGSITPEAIKKLRNGVEISLENQKYRTRRCKAELLPEPPSLPERGRKIRDERHGPTSWIRIILKEGKNRQIRKMTAAVGFPTLRLIRTAIGPFSISDMQPGEVRPINPGDFSGPTA